MSLTTHLDDPGSPIYAFMTTVSPRLEASRGTTLGARHVAEELGFAALMQLPTAVEVLPGADPRVSGTALDIRARIELGGFDAHDSASARGVGRLVGVTSTVTNGAHRARILTEAFDVAKMLLANTRDADGLDRAAVLLAHCEQVWRAGLDVLEGSLGDACDAAADGEAFARQISAPQIADVRSMLEANRQQLDTWRNMIDTGDRFDPNPHFVGEALVDGGDGDWQVGDTLIDCKAYADLTADKLHDFLLQLLGYVMLDLDDALKIRRVGLWLPRQRVTPTWDLSVLLGGDPEELLPTLRERFTRSANGKQVAENAPGGDRKKLIALVDNRHTPEHMLTALAFHEEEPIRWRVARNRKTPVPVLALLAEDAIPRVREAVASNERTPEMLLRILADDRSVVVRRAVAENPGGPTSATRQLAAREGRAQPPANPRSSEIVAIAPDQDAHEISHNRDDSALGTEWFPRVLIAISEGDVGRMMRLLGVRRENRWLRDANSLLARAEDFVDGLPRDLVDDLMHERRPSATRRVAATFLPVAEKPVRDALLADEDPEIRWDALTRSVGISDPDLSALLGELASSKQARKDFRTAGFRQSTWERALTPREYESQVLKMVARNPDTPTDGLLVLAESKAPEVLRSLLENPSLPRDQFDEIVARMVAHPRVPTRAALAAASTIPAETADELAGHSNLTVLLALASNRAAPLSSLTRLAACDDPAVREAVLNNPSTSLDLLSSIATRVLETESGAALIDMLRTLARRDDVHTPAGLVRRTLDRLSRPEGGYVDDRTFVAGYELTNAETLTRLSSCEESQVRSAVAGNRNTPVAVLRELASDPESRVREDLAENPNASREALRALLCDDSALVRLRARRNPSVREEDLPPAERRVARSAPNRESFEEMAGDKRADVRLRAAMHKDVPPDVLFFLAGERRSVKVKRAVAAHASTPSDGLRSLAGEEDWGILTEVALNPSTPPDVLAALASQSIELALLVAVNPGAGSGVADDLERDGEPLLAYVTAAGRNARARWAATIASGGLKRPEFAGDS